MKRVVFAPAALERLDDILAWTVEKFGEGQAGVYAAQLAGRIDVLAAGTGPKAQSCERLMHGVRDASGLSSSSVARVCTA